MSGYTALTYAEYLRDTLNTEVSVPDGQYFPLCAGGQRSFGIVGAYARDRRLPADLVNRSGLVAGTHRFHTHGSITAVEAVYVPADDMSDPAVAAILGHLDSTVILSRKQAAKGIYPAVDPLIEQPHDGSPFVGDRHYRVARAVREHIARYRELEDIIAMLGIEELSPKTARSSSGARRLERYLTQPFAVLAAHSGIKGARVPLDQTLTDCEGFLAGKFDAVNEADCYMRGSMSA